MQLMGIASLHPSLRAVCLISFPTLDIFPQCFTTITQRHIVVLEQGFVFWSHHKFNEGFRAFNSVFCNEPRQCAHANQSRAIFHIFIRSTIRSDCLRLFPVASLDYCLHCAKPLPGGLSIREGYAVVV